MRFPETVQLVNQVTHASLGMIINCCPRSSAWRLLTERGGFPGSKEAAYALRSGLRKISASRGLSELIMLGQVRNSHTHFWETDDSVMKEGGNPVVKRSSTSDQS